MNDSELKELHDIKRLLMVLILKSGGTPEELAYALEVHPSRISQMLPVRKIKKSMPKS